jgi:hypothetical protein
MNDSDSDLESSYDIDDGKYLEVYSYECVVYSAACSSMLANYNRSEFREICKN